MLPCVPGLSCWGAANSLITVTARDSCASLENLADLPVLSTFVVPEGEVAHVVTIVATLVTCIVPYVVDKRARAGEELMASSSGKTCNKLSQLCCSWPGEGGT
jgi:hypothetical protein